jgi:hypothetical protein
MTTVITVNEFASMPGRFECAHQTGPTGRVYNTTHAGGGPEAAAAYAVKIALQAAGPYVILGPKKVLDCIPPDIRSRAA